MDIVTWLSIITGKNSVKYIYLSTGFLLSVLILLWLTTWVLTFSPTYKVSGIRFIIKVFFFFDKWQVSLYVWIHSLEHFVKFLNNNRNDKNNFTDVVNLQVLRLCGIYCKNIQVMNLKRFFAFVDFLK